MYKIINDDCIEYLKKEENWNQFDLIFCDPPYNYGFDYGEGKKADQLSLKDYYLWCNLWMYLCWECLKPSGSLWLLTPEEHLDEFIKFYKNTKTGKIRTIITWMESFGVCRQNNFGKCSRFLVYFIKDKKNFTFNDDPIRVPSDRQLKYKDKRANPKGKIPSNVWVDIPRVCGTFNERIKRLPTQLPEKLLERIILCSSNEGDLVFDPMCGSGTTGAVALKNGRNFIGIEKNLEYCDIATNRLSEIK